MGCPVCRCRRTSELLRIERAPVFCNVLWDTRRQALSAPRAEIRLALCGRCGLIWNAAFDPRLVRYAPAYENSLHFSGRFQSYALGLARELVRNHGLRGKDIIEIGCGGGEFLAMLCRMGGNRGVGFDPAFRQEKAADFAGLDVKVLPKAYGASSAGRAVDFLCFRHVLEHIAEPMEFLAQVRAAIGRRRGCSVFCEVPNALHTLGKGGIWDVIYEHCCYFGPRSLAEAFRRAGFEPRRLRQRYQQQYVTIEAVPAPKAGRAQIAADVPPRRDTTAGLVRKFQAAYQQKLDAWRKLLAGLRRRSSRAVVWGGGSKAVSFLNVLQVGCGTVSCVVDVNPRKHGRFIPGTGQQIVPPERLARLRPREVIVMNPVYAGEIRQSLAEMGLCCRLLLA